MQVHVLHECYRYSTVVVLCSSLTSEHQYGLFVQEAANKTVNMLLWLIV